MELLETLKLQLAVLLIGIPTAVLIGATIHSLGREHPRNSRGDRRGGMMLRERRRAKKA